MIPIISIVGRSASGKTTLIERLIPEFIKRGYRVATIKHHGSDFPIDQEGKDSWRHKQAGAHTVVISSPQKVALVEDVSHDLSLNELASQFIQGADIIIAEGFKREHYPKVEFAEGFKREHYPKVEVFRKAIHPHPLAPELENVIAVVSDEPLPLETIPCLSTTDISGIADTIEKSLSLQKKDS